MTSWRAGRSLPSLAAIQQTARLANERIGHDRPSASDATRHAVKAVQLPGRGGSYGGGGTG